MEEVSRETPLPEKDFLKVRYCPGDVFAADECYVDCALEVGRVGREEGNVPGYEEGEEH